MPHDEQLAWEARVGKPAAASAFLSAALGVAAGIYLPIVLADREDGTDGLLEAVDSQPGDFVVAGVLQAASVLLLVPGLLYLFRATRYRRPALTPAAAVLLVLGALTVAVVTILNQLERIDIAHDFVPYEGGEDAEDAADEAIRDGLSPTLGGVGAGGTLALAFSLVMISLNAMRAGLLSRFMGVMGVALGVVFVLPLGIQPVLQLFWIVALGLLALGRWPGGRGPAWQTGEAIPWPGAAEQREEIERRRAEREGERGGQPDASPTPEADPEPDRPKPASRKRRKRRG